MKREDVERMLRMAEGVNEVGVLTFGVANVAALCRRWLAVEECAPIRITGRGTSWAGGGTTTLTVAGYHDDIELLKHYRIVPEPGEGRE